MLLFIYDGMCFNLKIHGIILEEIYIKQQYYVT